MKYLPTLLVTIIIFKLLFSKKKRRYRKRRYIRYKSRTARIKSNYTNSKKFKTARQRGRYELKKYKKSQYLNSEYYAKTLLPWKTIETDKGRRGEYEVYARLAQLDGPRDFFFNVYVPRDDGTTTEADIVMVHPRGLFVYEVKNYEGWIFGRFEQANWTQCLPGQFEAQKFKFLTP